MTLITIGDKKFGITTRNKNLTNSTGLMEKSVEC